MYVLRIRIQYVTLLLFLHPQQQNIKCEKRLNYYIYYL